MYLTGIFLLVLCMYTTNSLDSKGWLDWSHSWASHHVLVLNRPEGTVS